MLDALNPLSQTKFPLIMVGFLKLLMTFEIIQGNELTFILIDSHI
ncbi:hypothetical protein SAMN04488100_1449 [Alkalibacterium putridalgicola]|uniref:Uncharacterized protein n=1 Tax=Alkalibacterium putridalgicola TaxID=426703 RepID=A0A1H7X4A9_9LACT|nr:hypothetical protein SAMN04488100_1449 [Alkalibacterium putridalgicola]